MKSELIDVKLGRVVEFQMVKDKSLLRVEECCDNYFSADLTKAEVAELIAYIQALHDQMV